MSSPQDNPDSPKEARAATRWQKLRRFFYNSETGEFMGRTAKSWSLIGLFYLVFYTILAGFWVGMLAVFLKTFITYEAPFQRGAQSLLKAQPGISFKPAVNRTIAMVHASTVRGGRIFKLYTEFAEDFLDKNSETGVNTQTCSLTRDVTEFPDCQFNRKVLGPCDSPTTSLKNGQLCVYVTVNNVFQWLPDLNRNFSDLALECFPANTADNFHFKNFKYYPEMRVNGKNYGKFPTSFFPFEKKTLYSKPVVAVTLNEMLLDTIVMIKCKLAGLRDDAAQKFARVDLLLSSK